jgi:ABC-2 type transport system ATP-binding protein
LRETHNLMPAVVVERLRVVRGGTLVLRDLDCAVPGGQVTGILGPSGSGKTTLLRSVVGVQRVEAGTVTVLGHAAGTAALRSRVGYMTQAPSVYGDLTVRENLRFFARILGAGDVDGVIERVSLQAERTRVVNRLSGGQRARVSLAAALIGSPDLLVLDEPTVGLDPVLRRDLWQLFHELADGGTTLVVSSHVMDEAARCDVLVLLREGRVLAQGTPDQLRRDAGSDDLDQVFLTLVERQR